MTTEALQSLRDFVEKELAQRRAWLEVYESIYESKPELAYREYDQRALVSQAEDWIAALDEVMRNDRNAAYAAATIKTVLSGAGPVDGGIMLLHKDREEISNALVLFLKGAAR